MKFQISQLKLKNHIPTQPQIPNFLAEVDLPQAHPMDSADTLRLKAYIMMESYLDSLTRERYTWLDVTQSLAQRVSSGDIVTRDDISMLLDLLHNPGSENGMKALELLMS